MARGVPSGSFFGKIDRLASAVGDSDLTGEVVVDQPYALVQHEDTDLSHPRGGEAKYLENPLKEKYDRYLDGLAADVLPGRLQQGMTEVVEDLAGEVGRRAPVEEGVLRASASPRVFSGGQGTLLFERAPASPRDE